MNTPITPRTSKLHPVLWVAAIAVTIFSLVGIGAITGILPTNHAAEQAAPTPVVAATETPAETKASSTPVAKEPAKVATQHAEKHTEKRSTTHYSSKVAMNDGPASTNYSSLPPPPPPSSCRDCGTIESVRTITEKGEGTGLGGVLGGVLGGLVGNQVGNGNGRTVATIAGIAGGAYAGNQVEKGQRSKMHYEVTVRFEDGTTQLFRQETLPPWQSGDKVKVESGSIVPR